jgi:hypothetical protein
LLGRLVDFPAVSGRSYVSVIREIPRHESVLTVLLLLEPQCARRRHQAKHVADIVRNQRTEQGVGRYQEDGENTSKEATPVAL